MTSSATDPSTAATLVDVVMPQLGTSIAEGTVVAWRAAVGEAVAADAAVCEITTDKVDSECPAPVGGVLAEILVEAGETVDVGTPIARIAADGAAATPAGDAPASAPPGLSPASRGATSSTGAGGRVPPAPDGRRYSPVVRRIAATHGLDLASVAGSGRNGRVTKRDALAAVEAAATADPPLHSDSPYRPDGGPSPSAVDPSPPDDLGGVSMPLSRMRRSIGAAMLASQATAATCHTIVECDMSAVEERRRALGVTALPLVARAVVEVLRDFGDLNATLDGETITRYERVHLGIAVSLGDDGLIVPVIHDAQELSPEGLGSRIRDLATRARERRLEHDEVRGATFTITNPGAFGALIATPVIDVPQVAILDLEAIVRRPVVVTDGAGGESIGIRPLCNLILGWDHRAIDGVYAARFLSALRGRLEQPVV